MKKALITGALGQDGYYLSKYLLSLGYEVWGIVRLHPKLSENYVAGVKYEFADLTDTLSLTKVLQKSRPDEIYNLAGQVFVPNSWIHPVETFDVNVCGLARILDAVDKMKAKARVYQASTSEMYGNVLTSKAGIVHLDETQDMHPVSPYGVSKLAAHRLVDVYRQKGMYVVSGILFNHESPKRGPEMVTRKITRYVAKWAAGASNVLRLGQVSSKRDWGFAGDYVIAMHSMLQQDTPADYVVGTGKAHSVSEFLEEAIIQAGLTNPPIETDCPEFGRMPELHTLVADYSKARTQLSWEPKTSFKELVKMMVDADCEEIGVAHVQRA